MNHNAHGRDVIFVEVSEVSDDILVTAVDSCGAIGMKQHDSVAADPYITGLLTARVALMEVLSAGATPVFASIVSCNEQDTSIKLLSGVKEVLSGEYECPFVISTEKNMATCMTAVGVTITGLVKKCDLRIGCSQSGDTLYCAGIPLVGSEVLEVGEALFSTIHLKVLLDNKNVHSIIPVGSRGILAEAQVLADESGLKVEWADDIKLDIKKSAGPSTCALFSSLQAEPDVFNSGIPIYKIGVLI